MDINFEYYKIFYFVAKYGNITKAAAALGSNQPNVTRIMKLLEEQLNCKLFIRGARGVSLTEEGERLYSHVAIAYRNILDGQEEICGKDARKSGTIEIGATETALHLFLLQVLRGFKKEYPAIRIKIHNRTTLETIRHLLNGELDFAVITSPFEVPKTVSCLKVLDFEEILVGGTAYADLCGEPMEVKALKAYPLVGLGRETVTYELYKNFFVGHKVDMELDIEVATSDLMLPLLKNNFGMGFVPKQMAAPLIQDGELVQIPLNATLPRRSIQVIADRGRGKSVATGIFYKYLETGILSEIHFRKDYI